ncbi:MAG: hypothetical protein IJU65_05595 [Desulfovibrio sp.]|nr:hypothetical protein [Desulfovibrio sp.]
MRAPFGSTFRHPAVQAAMKNLADTAAQAEHAGVGLTPYRHPNGSAFEDAKVQAGLKGLADAANQASSAGVGQSMFKRPTGSAFDNARVQDGLTAMGRMAEEAGRQAQGPGVTDRRHPVKVTQQANTRAAQLTEHLTDQPFQNRALYAAHNALNGGEIAPEMLARYDQPRYQTGCEKLLNMIPMPQGGITKRPGFQYVGFGGYGGQAKLFPFIFSANESRMLEFYAAGAYCTLYVWFPDGTKHETGLSLPYWDDFSKLQIAQSADVLYIAHPKCPPAKIMRNGDYNWTYEVIDWLPAINGVPGATVQGVSVVADGNVENARMYEKQMFDYQVTAIDAETGEESLPSAVASVYTHPLSEIWYTRISWAGMTRVSEYRIYKKKSGVFGYIGSAYTSERQTSFEDHNIAPDTEDTPPRCENPFDGEGKYPSVVFLHQQRTGWASSDTRPLTIWFSQSGNFESMAASIPPADDDSIEVTLAATQANRILWCQSDRDGLAVGTEGGEWLLKASEGAALTPSDLNFQPQTYHGSERGLPVLRAGSHLLYMQRGGRVVREFGYSFAADRYESNDVSILARHMLRDTHVVAWAWQGEPYGIVWCVTAVGELVALTYMKEHDILGWHRHVTDGWVQDVACIPNSRGNTDLWALVNRNGRRYVEKLAPFFTGGISSSMHKDGIDQTEFAARCIPCLPETTVSNGTTLLRVRKINAVKARVIFSKPFAARVGESAPLPVPARGAAYTEGHADWAVPLASGWRENDRLELIFDGPDPATVLGIVTTVELADMAGSCR